jgi:hypothetical protein
MSAGRAKTRKGKKSLGFGMSQVRTKNMQQPREFRMLETCNPQFIMLEDYSNHEYGSGIFCILPEVAGRAGALPVPDGACD